MVACVACGRRDATPLYEVNGFPIVKCRCGLARTELPDGFDPASIYTEAYFQGGHRDGYADYMGSGDELRHEFRRILHALQKHAPGGKLVELGCAYGFFLTEAQTAFETCGVEISDHARAACAERGLDVAREATLDFLASRGPFDAAVMLDVLEHMRDPATALDRLHATMAPGAQLLITTGDYGSMLSRAMGKRWRLMTPPQHLWFFSRATITTFLARHGFEVHTFEHPWKLVPLALVAYQATRYLGGQDVVKKFVPGGRMPINLFDAMRVIATRIERTSPAAYEVALRHARGRVLEVACGTGEGADRLRDRGAEVVGVDRSADAIEVARERHARPGLAFTCEDELAYHDRDGFDTVVALGALERTPDPEQLIVRMIAAMKPGAVLVATTPATARPIFERFGMRVLDESPSATRSTTIAWTRG